VEEEYLKLMNETLMSGARQRNRTGIDSFMIPGAMLKFDLQKGFPAVTTKKLAFNAVKGELIGFLRGYTSAAQFRELGCNIWNQNANENQAWLANPNRTGVDDLGYIYSKLWTEMPNPEGESWNQISRLIRDIRADPTSRRLIVSAWHPEVFHKAALPPCHVLFQVILDQEEKVLHLNMYQRSCDLFLGVPFNIASYSLLAHMLGRMTGYTPKWFTWFGGDCHVYENHVEQVWTQLSREPLPPPQLSLEMGSAIENDNIALVEPENISLINYNHHPPLTAPMAV
jgi:thymidylate synthase